MNEAKPTVAVDFDGVLNDYSGWKGEEDLGQPLPGARAFLFKLSFDYRVVVYSTRDRGRISRWLQQHDLDGFVSAVSNEKPVAVAYIDDRAICFDGDYDAVWERLVNFTTHWERAQGKI